MDQWTCLPTPVRLWVAESAMARAAKLLAKEAESLAAEIDDDLISDRGGAEALRYFARIIRAAASADQVVGNA